MSDVLISFVGDTTKLQPAIDVLDQIIAKSGVIAEKWKQISVAMNAGNSVIIQGATKLSESIDKVGQSQIDVANQAKVTSTAIDNQNKTGIDGTNKLTKSIEGLAVATKKLPEAIIGAAYADTLKKINVEIAQFSKMGVEGAQKIGTELRKLIANEEELKNAIKTSTDPELTKKYEESLKQTSATVSVLRAALETLQKVKIDVPIKIDPPGQDEITALINKLREQISTNKFDLPVITAAESKLPLLDNSTQSYKDLSAAITDVRNAMGGIIETEDEIINKTKDLNTVFDKAFNDLLKSSESLSSTDFGTGYTKFLKDIQSQLQLTNAEVVKFLQNSRKNLQVSISNSIDPKETETLKKALTETNAQIDLFSQKEKKAGASTQNFTTELRSLRNQIESIQLAIKEGTATTAQVEQLDVLTNKYTSLARVQKQFQIETKGLVANDEVIAGTISLVSGVAGAYAVASSAQILFGDSSDQLQQSLQKLFAITNLLNGLQQITAVIQKSSAGSILLESIFRTKQTEATKAGTIAQEASNLATKEQIVVTEGQAVVEGEAAVGASALAAADVALAGGAEVATAATIGLNTALLANPVTAVIVGLLALLAAVNAISSADHSAEIEQRKLNDALQEATTFLDFAVQSNKNATDKQLAQQKLLGASAVELSAIRGEAAKRDLESVKEQSNALSKTIIESQAAINALEKQGKSPDKEQLDLHQKVVEEKTKLDIKYANDASALQTQLLDHQKLINDADLNELIDTQHAKVLATIAGSDSERAAQINELNKTQAARIKLARESGGTIAEQNAIDAKIIAEDERQTQGLQLQNFQHYLKGRTAAVDAEIAIVKAHQAVSDADQIANINKVTELQVAALKRQRAEALSNPTLNINERRKIEEESDLAIFEAKKKNEIDILNFQKQGISNLLAASKKGSFEEAVFKLDQIEIDRKAEVAAAGKNVDLINTINAKFAKQRIDADIAQQQIQLQNIISLDNAALDHFGLIESEKLPIVLRRLETQQALEILGAENNANKIAEIEAKFDKQRIDARKASLAAELALNLKIFDEISQQGTKKNENIISNPLSSETAKQIANDQILKDQQFRLDLERDKLEKDKLHLSDEEFHIQLQDLQNKQDEINQAHSNRAVQIFKDEQDKKLAVLAAAISVIQNGVDLLDTSSLKTGLTQVLGLFTQIGSQIAANKAIQIDPNATQDQKDASAQLTKDKIVTESIVATQAIINQVFADSAAQRQQEINDHITALENQKNVELDNTNLTAKQKDEINKRYAEKERQVKIAGFNASKEAAKEEAVINGLLAVTNALATVHPFLPAGLIAAGIAAASAAIQVAAIGARKTPKFFRGQVDIQGEGTTTSDDNLVRISHRESIIAAQPTIKWKEALTAINEDKFEHWLDKKISVEAKWKEASTSITNNHHDSYLTKNIHSFIYPEIPEYVRSSTTYNNISRQEIDYDKLAEAIAKKMPPPRSTHVNIDANGIHTMIEEGVSKKEIKNRRYSMND